MIIVNLIAFILLIIGALNWGLVGIFGLNLVTLLFGGIPALVTIVYVIILIAAIWLIITPFLNNGHIDICNRQDRK